MDSVTFRVYHSRDRQWGIVYPGRDGAQPMVRWACGFWQSYRKSRLIREERGR